MEVHFYSNTDDKLLKFVVIIAVYHGKFVFCKHKERSTFELPGGHREENEEILLAAKRELEEETGAIDYDISPICIYSVTGKTRVNQTGEETFGMLYFAEIKTFNPILHSEIEKIVLMKNLPTKWTYPLIQPKLIDYAISQHKIIV